MSVLDMPGFHHKLSTRCSVRLVLPGQVKSSPSISKVWVRRRWQSFRLSLQDSPEGKDIPVSPVTTEVLGSWRHWSGTCPTPVLTQSSEVLSAAVTPPLSPLPLLSEYSYSPAVLPNITNPFVFNFTWIPWFCDSPLWGGVRRATGFSPSSNVHHEKLQHCWQLQATHPVLK